MFSETAEEQQECAYYLRIRMLDQIPVSRTEVVLQFEISNHLEEFIKLL